MNSIIRSIVLALACGVMSGAVIVPSQAFADGMVWKVKSNYKYKVQIAFYSQTRKHEWPGGGDAYNINDYQDHDYTIACNNGEKICLGGWVTGKLLLRLRRRIAATPSSRLTSARLTSAAIKARPLTRAFFARDVHDVAPDLIGTTLLVDGVGGTIVEVEAYHYDDPAAHGFGGRTARNAAMFGPPGHAYVYRSYGLHWCLNFVCGPQGIANAVLIRAVEPTAGIAAMQARRNTQDVRLLCAGPGRLCQALAVTRAHYGLALDKPPFRLLARSAKVEIAVGRRIGITKAADRPWRYGLAGSRFVSRPFKE